jgi:hypothetical protein
MLSEAEDLALGTAVAYIRAVVRDGERHDFEEVRVWFHAQPSLAHLTGAVLQTAFQRAFFLLAFTPKRVLVEDAPAGQPTEVVAFELGELLFGLHGEGQYLRLWEFADDYDDDAAARAIEWMRMDTALKKLRKLDELRPPKF